MVTTPAPQSNDRSRTGYFQHGKNSVAKCGAIYETLPPCLPHLQLFHSLYRSPPPQLTLPRSHTASMRSAAIVSAAVAFFAASAAGSPVQAGGEASGLDARQLTDAAVGDVQKRTSVTRTSIVDDKSLAYGGLGWVHQTGKASPVYLGTESFSNDASA